MSNIIAKISNIEAYENIHIIEFTHKKYKLSMMSLNISNNIKIGTKVKLVIKPTHIAIGKDISGELSYANQLKVTIISVENGKLLSSIRVDFDGTILESVITLKSSLRMDLKPKDDVIIFIKASDLSIGEIIDD